MKLTRRYYIENLAVWCVGNKSLMALTYVLSASLFGSQMIVNDCAVRNCAVITSATATRSSTFPIWPSISLEPRPKRERTMFAQPA